MPMPLTRLLLDKYRKKAGYPKIPFTGKVSRSPSEHWKLINGIAVIRCNELGVKHKRILDLFFLGPLSFPNLR